MSTRTPSSALGGRRPRVNRSAARRRAAELSAHVSAPPVPLAQPQADYLASFQPKMFTRAAYATGRAAVVEVMERAAHIKGLANFMKHTSDVTVLVAWAIGQGRSLGWQALMSHDVIHDFARHPDAGASEAHRSDRMRRLKNLASHLNTGPDAPPRPAPVGHRSVQPPYSPAEDAAIVQIALTQRSPVVRRQLCAVVGLCRGAGCGNDELRFVHRGHVHDRGTDGIDVTLGGGDTQRVVPVRRGYEQLVRIAIDSVPTNGLLLGRVQTRRNVANRIVEAAEILGTAPRIEASRLRTSWIAELMTEPIPVSVILTAAGLKSARTLTDLLPLLSDPATQGSLDQARGVAR